MMDGSKYRSKGYAMGNAGRKLPYVFLLLLGLAAGVLSVVVLQKVREQHFFAQRLQERDRQLVSLRILLQKEKAFNREMKRKAEEMKATASSLRTQKTDQRTKLKGLEATVAELKKTQKELEAALAGKDNHINQMEEAATNLKKARRELEATVTEKDRHIKQMEEKAATAENTQKELEAALSEKNSRIRQMEEKATGSNPDQMAALMEILQRKEAELEEIKIRFQDFKRIERADVNSKSTPTQTNNASATTDVVVAIKATNSSSIAIPTKSDDKRSANITTVGRAKPEEKRSANTTAVGNAKPEEKKSANTTAVGNAKPDEKISANTTAVGSAKPEEKISANTTAVGSAKPEEKRPATTVVESKRPKSRSLEEKAVTDIEDDGIQDNLNDFDEDIDIDDIYGESRSRKTGSPKKNKKFLSNNLDGTGNPLDQDSDRLLEKEKTKAVQGMVGATDVKKPDSNVPVNNDEAKQQNRKQKKKRSKSKKKKVADVVGTTNVSGEVAKQRAPGATSI